MSSAQISSKGVSTHTSPCLYSRDRRRVNGVICFGVRTVNAAHASVLRSSRAHAKIKSIDTTAAKNAPGVLAVLTGEYVAKDRLGDMPCLVPVQNLDGTARGDTLRAIRAKYRVRQVSDPVVAETLAQTRDAAELVDVD